MRRTLCMLLALGSMTARAADFKGEARVWLGVGIDTNPRRDFSGAAGESTIPPDGFGSVVASGNALVQTDWGRVYGAYDFGGRKFLLYRGEDTLVQSASLDGSVFLGRYLAVGLNGRARDRRGAERDYSDLIGDLYLEYSPDPKVSVKAHFGAHRFLYWDRFSASFWGPGAGASAQYRFTRRHSVSLFADAEPRSFNANACLDDGSTPATCVTDRTPPRRRDSFFSVGLGYTYRGPFVITVQYAYVDSTSNSYGETYRRHRFSGTAGFRLPLGFTVLAAGAVQIAEYPNGVFLSSDLILLEDDENANNFSLKLVHPLGSHFDLDLKYSLYYSKLNGKVSGDDRTYLRMVGSVGLAWHW